MNTLNEAILAGFERLLSIRGPGGYRFDPSPRGLADPTNPRDPHHDGVTHDRFVGAERLLRADPGGATYCCGLTLELWWDAVEAAGGPCPRDLDDARAFVDTWFCPVMGHPGAATALLERRWATRVPPRDAIAGDLIQFWRSVDLVTPSGHSAVVLGWQGDRLRYASSQPKTGGVGIHEEDVRPNWLLYVVRPLTGS